MKTLVIIILLTKVAYSQFEFSANFNTSIEPPKLSYEENKRHISNSYTQDYIANELISTTIQNTIGNGFNKSMNDRFYSIINRYDLNLNENQETLKAILIKAGIDSVYPSIGGALGGFGNLNVDSSRLAILINNIESAGITLPSEFEVFRELSYINLIKENERKIFEKLSKLDISLQSSIINKVSVNFHDSDTFIEKAIQLEVSNNSLDKTFLRNLLFKLLNKQVINPSDKNNLLIQLILDYIDIDFKKTLNGDSTSIMCSILQEAIAFRDGNGMYRDIAIHGDAYSDQLHQYVEYLNLLISYDSDLDQECDKGIIAIDLIAELNETGFLDFAGTYLESILSDKFKGCFNDYVGVDVVDFCLNISVLDKIYETLLDNTVDISGRNVGRDITYVTNKPIGECSISIHNSMIRKVKSSETYSLYINVVSPYHKEEVELSSDSVNEFIVKFKKITKRN